MPNKPRWQIQNHDHGIQTVELRSWQFFGAYVAKELVDYPDFIFRGQPSDAWPLEPSLDRALRTIGRVRSETIRAQHRREFMMAARGRRGSSPPPIDPDAENLWWALGQHQGLLTPLLDWTSSPYVAAYFAFIEPPRVGEAWRAVYAIDQAAFEERSAEIRRATPVNRRPHVVEFVRPMSDENARLVSQGGLFTRAPDGTDIEKWVKDAFPPDFEYIVMLKLNFPITSRIDALIALNRMNINHLSLFPDLFGASQFCNNKLLIRKY